MPVLAELRRNLVAKLRVPAARVDETIAFLTELECIPATVKTTARPPERLLQMDEPALARTVAPVLESGEGERVENFHRAPCRPHLSARITLDYEYIE